MPSEEEVPTMDVVGLPEEDHLPDWMSQLFDKLDSEVNEAGVCPTGNMAQVDIHPPLECGISSEIHVSSEEKKSIRADACYGVHGEELSDWTSQLFEKLDLEVNEDDICSTGNVTQVEAHPVAEEVISSKNHMSTKLKDPSMDEADDSGFLFGEDAFLDWIVDTLKKGGHDDILAEFDLDQEAVHHDVQDELSDHDENAEVSHRSVKRVSSKETIENGIKWMSEECFLAFTKSAERDHFEGIEHKFGELRRQCLNIEAYDKIFHHYNFTIEAKYGGSDV